MAVERLSMKTGKAGKAAPHAAYINREAPYEHRLNSGERLEAKDTGNLPAWAAAEPNRFWQAADAHERANGTTYREMEIALPRELSPSQRLALVRGFVQQELGTRHAYQWAIHNSKAADGGDQPHVHLMFSERRTDGIERDPDHYFRRHNAKAPEKGGAKKGYGPYSGGYLSQAERVAHLKGVRQRWEIACNAALAQAGRPERIDMRSHAERGTGFLPERKLWPREWRQPETRALVLAFREARSEQRQAQTALKAILPHPSTELIRLDAERHRQQVEKAKRERQQAEAECLAAERRHAEHLAREALQSALRTVCGWFEEITYPHAQNWRPSPDDSPDAYRHRVLPWLENQLIRLITASGYSVPSDTGAVRQAAQDSFIRLERQLAAWNQAEATAREEAALLALRDAKATLLADIPAWDDAAVLAYWEYVEAQHPTAEEQRAGLLRDVANVLRTDVERAGHDPTLLPPALFEAASMDCYEPISVRCRMTRYEHQRQAGLKTLEAAVERFCATGPRTPLVESHPYQKQPPEASEGHQRRIASWIRGELSGMLNEQFLAVPPSEAEIENAARRCFGPFMAQVERLVAQEAQQRLAQQPPSERRPAAEHPAITPEAATAAVDRARQSLETLIQLAARWNANPSHWQAVLAEALGRERADERDLNRVIEQARQRLRNAENALENAYHSSNGTAIHADAPERSLSVQTPEPAPPESPRYSSPIRPKPKYPTPGG